MPFEPDTAIGGHAHRFPLTRLSLLENASSSETLDNDALHQIIELYWKPTYKYIRLKWRKSNEEAKDLTQGFFATALERGLFKHYDPRQASFRTYLRMALDRFAANDHTAARREKRGGNITFVDCEDGELDLATASAASPEEQFQREWQRQLFTLAIEDLRQHCHQTGKQLQFQVFEAFDLADRERPTYADLAERHNITATTLNNYIAWARRRLKSFVTERLRGVTSGERELHEEVRSAFTR